MRTKGANFDWQPDGLVMLGLRHEDSVVALLVAAAFLSRSCISNKCSSMISSPRLVESTTGVLNLQIKRQGFKILRFTYSKESTPEPKSGKTTLLEMENSTSLSPVKQKIGNHYVKFKLLKGLSAR